MIRALPRLFLVFLVPFALYLVWILARRENPLAVNRWTRRVLIPLVALGLCCVVAGLLLVGLTAPRYEGGYRPAHLENGRIVPGDMR